LGTIKPPYDVKNKKSHQQFGIVWRTAEALVKPKRNWAKNFAAFRYAKAHCTHALKAIEQQHTQWRLAFLLLDPLQTPFGNLATASTDLTRKNTESKVQKKLKACYHVS